MSAAPYTCWPVFVISINLPPGVCFQRQNIFVSLIIPGHPGNKMGVYMEPLTDELVLAWEEGVWTYDRAMKTNFRMHVWYQYSMHDEEHLPADEAEQSRQRSRTTLSSSRRRLRTTTTSSRTPQVQAAQVRGASTCEAPRVSLSVPYFGTGGR
jgi:hypothetical protein